MKSHHPDSPVSESFHPHCCQQALLCDSLSYSQPWPAEEATTDLPSEAGVPSPARSFWPLVDDLDKSSGPSHGI